MTPATSETGAGGPDIWTIKRILDFSVGYLKDRGAASPRVDAEILLGHVLRLSRIELYTGFDKPLTPAEKADFRALLKRRAQGEPIAYITGERAFFGHVFRVTPAVLIPRPDTETLVERFLAEPGVKERPLRVLDVGTGSGAIAITVSLALPDAEVVAWDVSEAALAVADENQRRLGSRVRFEKRDALADASWDEAAGFDYVLSNPPYIGAGEIGDMGADVLAHEPKAALFAEENGLIFYRRFAASAHRVLASHGKIMVEHGFRQADAVAEAFAGPAWVGHGSIKDLAGHPRVFVASKA